MEVTVELPAAEGAEDAEKAVIVLPSLGDGGRQARRRPSGHRFLSVAVKRAICEFKEKTPGANTKQIQQFADKQLGIKHLPRSTVHTILGDKEKYLNFDDSVMDASKTLRMRRGRCEKMESVLYAWYKKAKATGVHISDAQIVAVARHLGHKLDVPENFAYSNGWLSNWKVRKGIYKVPPKRNRSKNSTSSSPQPAEATSGYFVPPSPNAPDENNRPSGSKIEYSSLGGLGYDTYPMVVTPGQGIDNISVTFIKEPAIHGRGASAAAAGIAPSSSSTSSSCSSSSAELVDTLANVKLLAEQALGAATLEKQLVRQLAPESFHMACEDIKAEPEDDDDEEFTDALAAYSAHDQHVESVEGENINNILENNSGDEQPPVKKIKMERPSIRQFKVPSTSKNQLKR